MTDEVLVAIAKRTRGLHRHDSSSNRNAKFGQEESSDESSEAEWVSSSDSDEQGHCEEKEGDLTGIIAEEDGEIEMDVAIIPQKYKRAQQTQRVRSGGSLDLTSVTGLNDDALEAIAEATPNHFYGSYGSFESETRQSVKPNLSNIHSIHLSATSAVSSEALKGFLSSGHVVGLKRLDLSGRPAAPR